MIELVALLVLTLAVLVLLPITLMQRSVIAELERTVEQLESDRDEARHAASDFQEQCEQQADELRQLKGPRPRRPARWN